MVGAGAVYHAKARSVASCAWIRCATHISLTSKLTFQLVHRAALQVAPAGVVVHDVICPDSATGCCDITVFVRSQTSDVDVMRQLYGDNEYGMWCCPAQHAIVRVPPRSGKCVWTKRASQLISSACDVGFLENIAFEPELVLDAGANVGLAAMLFAAMWPRAQIISLEPDKNNFAMLQLNAAMAPTVRPVNVRPAVKLPHLHMLQGFFRPTWRSCANVGMLCWQVQVGLWDKPAYLNMVNPDNSGAWVRE